MIRTNRHMAVPVAMLLLCIGCGRELTSTATKPDKYGHEPGEFVEATRFHDMVGRADCVKFAQREVTDKKVILELQQGLQFRRVSLPCECEVWPGLDFYSNGKVLASVSIHHGNRLRSQEWQIPQKVKSLWTGDLILTPESTAFLKTWMQRNLGTAIDD
jgi:hypothetical protein